MAPPRADHRALPAAPLPPSRFRLQAGDFYDVFMCPAMFQGATIRVRLQPGEHPGVRPPREAAAGGRGRAPAHAWLPWACRGAPPATALLPQRAGWLRWRPPRLPAACCAAAVQRPALPHAGARGCGLHEGGAGWAAEAGRRRASWEPLCHALVGVAGPACVCIAACPPCQPSAQPCPDSSFAGGQVELPGAWRCAAAHVPGVQVPRPRHRQDLTHGAPNKLIHEPTANCSRNAAPQVSHFLRNTCTKQQPSCPNEYLFQNQLSLTAPRAADRVQASANCAAAWA